MNAIAADEGIGEEDRLAIVSAMAADPKAGVVMAGTGGGAVRCDLRVAAKARAEVYRVVTFFWRVMDIPVFLLDVYGKDSQSQFYRKRNENELREISNLRCRRNGGQQRQSE